MASIQKYTNDAVRNMIRHNAREIVGNSNTDIDTTKTSQNYSFAMPSHGGKSDYKYYKELVESRYIYGRGTSRESSTITACSWVVTCPKEIVVNPEKVNAFFEGTYNFISHRYGAENIISNSVHFDEAGEPHIHVLFAPSTAIDHDKIHYKTIKDKNPTITNTGRYEIGTHYKLENGERVPIKNYAKMSDYYDYKLSANDVINKYELQHFHQDLQRYLDTNGIEGRVLNGATTGGNFTVKELKEFTKNTGLTLDEVKTQLTEHTLLESYVERATKVQELEATIKTRNAEIEQLKREAVQHKTLDQAQDKLAYQKEIENKNNELERLDKKISQQNAQIKELNQSNEALKAELEKAQERIAALEKEKQVEVTEEVTKGNERQSGWSNSTHSGWSKSIDHEEVRTW